MWLLVVFGKRLLSPGCVCVPFLSIRSHQGGDKPPDTGKLWLRREEIRRLKSFLLLLENLEISLLVDSWFLLVWFQIAQFFASTPVDLPEFRIHIFKRKQYQII